MVEAHAPAPAPAAAADKPANSGRLAGFRKRMREAALPFFSELLIGALLALGAVGFGYLFLKRAYQNLPSDLAEEEVTPESAPAIVPAPGAVPAPPAKGAASAPPPSPVVAPLPATGVYPAPGSEVLGDGADLPSSRQGFTETLIAWGFAADGLLEIREDSPTGRARFLPLRNQGVIRARLRAGRRYEWRVLSEERQKTLAGPYRFTLRSPP